LHQKKLENRWKEGKRSLGGGTLCTHGEHLEKLGDIVKMMQGHRNELAQEKAGNREYHLNMSLRMVTMKDTGGKTGDPMWTRDGPGGEVEMIGRVIAREPSEGSVLPRETAIAIGRWIENRFGGIRTSHLNLADAGEKIVWIVGGEESQKDRDRGTETIDDHGVAIHQEIIGIQGKTVRGEIRHIDEMT
jgi:hypothetical protein